MNKNIIFLSILFILIGFNTSCGSDDSKPVSVGGEWITVERLLSTNDPSLDKNVNDLFLEDSKNYIVKRIFDINTNDSSLGSIQTVAVDDETGILIRKRIGVYSITPDSLFIEDENIADMRQGYLLGYKSLITHTKVTKKELDALVAEMGGDPNTVREGTVGILKMREMR